MFWGFSTHGFRISGKKFLAILLLFFPSFAWLYLFENLLLTFIQNLILIDDLTANIFWSYTGRALFYISIVSSAIIGSIISEKWNRRRFLGIWILLGVITIPLFGLFQELIFFLVVGVFGGVSFGLGFPSTLAFFAESTTVEERARVAGILVLITFISLIPLIGFFPQLGLIGFMLLCIIFRAISFFALLIDSCEKVACKKKRWTDVFSTNGFLLYFLSWLMFSVAGGLFDFISPPQSLDQESISILGSVFLYLGVVPSSLFSGFAADHFGRKKILMFGLIILGISYGLFSLATSHEAYLLTRVIYGAAWGVIFVTYGFTVIGDFAVTCSKEKFYAIGLVVPFIVFMVFQSFSDAFRISIEPSLFSAILSMILFISVIPLLYAPETLPIDKIRRRRFEKHLNKVKKIVKEERTRRQN